MNNTNVLFDPITSRLITSAVQLILAGVCFYLIKAIITDAKRRQNKGE